MESIVSTLGQSREALFEQSRLFVDSTREAGRSLVDKTREAGSTFVQETREAGGDFAHTTRVAGEGLVGGVGSEVRLLREALGETGGELGRGARALLTPRGVERQLLVSISGAMTEAVRALDARIDALALPEATELKLPLPKYESMTAKDVVSHLSRLNEKQLLAVYEFEQANKSRATVLRAAESKLAAAA